MDEDGAVPETNSDDASPRQSRTRMSEACTKHSFRLTSSSFIWTPVGLRARLMSMFTTRLAGSHIFYQILILCNSASCPTRYEPEGKCGIPARNELKRPAQAGLFFCLVDSRFSLRWSAWMSAWSPDEAWDRWGGGLGRAVDGHRRAVSLILHHS